MRPIDADAFRDWWLYNGENEHIYDTNDILDSIDNWSTITSSSEWVSVEERLPEEGEKCLLYTPRDGFIYVGFYDGNDTRNHRHKWRLFTAMRATQTLIKKVTHWMFLPEPPDRNPLKRGGDGR